jgi:hypothetical protein
MAHSPTRAAFLQQNPADFESQARVVNPLWGTFFAAYHELERKEQYIEAIAKLSKTSIS